MSAEAGQQKSDALQELMAIVQVTPGQNLSPIPEGACSEVREFTETVRALFAALEMSLTRFSVHMHCDKGTVSRYLSGERIPPQDFLDRLFKSIYDARGALITPEVQSLIHEQYLVALRAHNPARYQVQKLSDQLAVAMLEKQQSELTIFALQDAIVKKQEKIYALEMDKRAIQDAWAAERQESDEAIEGELSLRHRLEQTIRNLRHDVQKLNERLRSTQLRARAAEERCQQLEAQVDQQLEAQIHSADASTMDEQPTVNTPRRRPRAPTRPPEICDANLRAWLYDVDQDGTSRAMLQTGGQWMKALSSGGTLHVSVDDGKDTATEKYLKPPPAVGMASEPITVSWDHGTGFWIIRNSGHMNTLRVQQYGLSAIPLSPQSEMPMSGGDVAVWIPVLPRVLRRNDSGEAFRRNENGEAFRLVILSTKEPNRTSGQDHRLTYTRIHPTPATQEALIAYFGSHLCWPPLPAPHVRQQSEVVEIARSCGLQRDQSLENWAMNRHDVLAGPDGLFKTTAWYPSLGGRGRTLANHLAAFHRLVELGTIRLHRVQQWAKEQDVRPYVVIDENLLAD